jgi:hypothetical protein
MRSEVVITIRFKEFGLDKDFDEELRSNDKDCDGSQDHEKPYQAEDEGLLMGYVGD